MTYLYNLLLTIILLIIKIFYNSSKFYIINYIIFLVLMIFYLKFYFYNRFLILYILKPYFKFNIIICIKIAKNINKIK